jgi:hypothetical protein
MSSNTGMNPMSGDSGMTRNDASRRIVAGVFQDRDHASQAIDDLRAAGFRPEDVGVAMRDAEGRGTVVHDAEGNKAAEGAGAGALGGGLLGGVLGWLVGLGALAIPGIGPVLAGGALATAFGIAGGTAVAGAGIGAATGGVAGALVGLGLPESEAKYFEQGLHAGGMLVTVNAGQRADDALAILQRHGADTGPASQAARGQTGTASSGTMSEGTTRTDSGDLGGRTRMA